MVTRFLVMTITTAGGPSLPVEGLMGGCWRAFRGRCLLPSEGGCLERGGGECCVCA